MRIDALNSLNNARNLSSPGQIWGLLIGCLTNCNILPTLAIKDYI